MRWELGQSSGFRIAGPLPAMSSGTAVPISFDLAAEATALLRLKDTIAARPVWSIVEMESTAIRRSVDEDRDRDRYPTRAWRTSWDSSS